MAQRIGELKNYYKVRAYSSSYNVRLSFMIYGIPSQIHNASPTVLFERLPVEHIPQYLTLEKFEFFSILEDHEISLMVNGV